MKSKVFFVLIIVLIFGAQSAFGQFNSGSVFHWDFNAGDPARPLRFLPSAILAAAASTDAEVEVPQTLRNNQYFLESQRLTRMAQSSYDEGDYDSSYNYAEEAVRYAELSDEYVALQLKIKETNDAIAAARRRLDWAEASGAAGQHPAEYEEAQGYYSESISFRSEENWDEAINSAHRVINILAYIGAPDDQRGLPSQYTVRTWANNRDCLWNIAGYTWVYGDPFKWQLLYDANKSNMEDPNNPHLIHPGMILTIPSIRGEERSGMWDSSRTYEPLR